MKVVGTERVSVFIVMNQIIRVQRSRYEAPEAEWLNIRFEENILSNQPGTGENWAPRHDSSEDEFFNE